MSHVSSFFHSMKSPLARRLIIAIVLFSASITLVMTAIQLYNQYQRDLAGIEVQFRQIEEVHLRSLTQAVWATNDKETQLQLEGLLKLPSIAYVAVEEVGGARKNVQTQAGQRRAGQSIERRYAMHYDYLDKPRHIGTLTVVATLDEIYRQLLQQGISILLNNAFHTFLVAIFVFGLFHRLITRHLAAVAGHLRDLEPGVAVAPLDLARAASTTPDELDVLVTATNQMQAKGYAALAALSDSEARVRLLLESTAEAIYGTDMDGICTFANPACVRMLGYTSEEALVGKDIHDLIHHTHLDGRPYPFKDCAMHIATLNGQACHRKDEVHWRANGSGFPVEYRSHPMYKDGELVGSVVTFVDISAHQLAEAELHRLAYYDNLTGLPNRPLFNDRLHQAVADAKRRGTFVAVMLLDIDRFKVINDTMGHEAGDRLLQEIAMRLKNGVREGDTVARLGGDEFALVLAGVADMHGVSHLAENVLSRFAAPITIDGREVFTGASIGVALYPTDTSDTESLLKFADSAMYHAKESGRNNYQFYSHEMTTSVQARLGLETDLRHALERNEFFLHYQPQVDAAHGRITGVEALLRWRNGSGAIISPAEFIPLAEETGLIVPIGDWVLETACRQLKRWHEAGHTTLTMSVNVASRQFREPLFGQDVGRIFAATRVLPSAIELEITESLLLENNEETRRTLDQIKVLGATLAIDDFGTGYSSLSYLKRFPLDRVKIDQSFVRDLGSDPDDLAIVRAIVALSRSLKLDVIAEGVETEEQLALLRSEGCDEYQGYLFARPMDADSVSRLLESNDALSTRFSVA